MVTQPNSAPRGLRISQPDWEEGRAGRRKTTTQFGFIKVLRRRLLDGVGCGADGWPIGRFISRNRKLDRAFVAPKHFTALPLATDRSRWCWWWIGLPEGQSRSLTEIAALRISSIDVTQRT